MILIVRHILLWNLGQLLNKEFFLKYMENKIMSFFLKEEQSIPKTVDDVILKLTEILEDLQAVQKNSEEDIKNAENAIFTWQENKVYSESEVLRAKSISEKLKALLS